MPAKGASTAKQAARLPPLYRLAVQRPNARLPNPCEAIMVSVLSCWASAGANITGCEAIETSLRACMDQPKPAKQAKNSINYHLGRFYPRLIGARKRK